MKLVAGSLAYLALAVVLGAFVAHSLKGRLDEAATAVFHTGQTYQVTSALALAILGFCQAHWPSVKLKWPALLLVLGSLVFSGSLYALAMSGVRAWGAVTPIGGVLVITSLLWSSLALYRSATTQEA